MNRTQATALIKDFLHDILEKEEWYQNIKPAIKAVVLYGSVAKGMNRKDSDIDFLIILPLEIEERFTDGEYFYDYKGEEMNIVLRSIERLRKLAAGKHDSFEAEVFRNCEFIIEKDGEARELIEKIGKK